ncbi:phosphotransferase enzyme family protein [Metarhizium guizhouense ARSEF 977]|uniref:Phosphotransferase enzyme family protein n=1 Tax=Metarhizium guizhouense (strain ARSEF 977) TaxID=1276136 RepID=A0A0B4GT34_METGA|nr:phosphotransferase enzyme family protein [Metarhizium guizhouense ARSEF 977]
MAMNPEREKMLRDASAKENELPNPPRVKCIRITGSNVVALKDTNAARPKPDRPDATQTSATTSRKRSRDLLEQENLGDVAFDNRLRRQHAPPFPLPPPPSHHTTYLTSLLQGWLLRLTLEPKPTKKSVPAVSTHMDQITSVGLLVNELMRRMGLPVLRLPTLNEKCLSASQKYDMARQVRKFVTQLRKTPRQNAQLGSIASGKCSLMLDKHQNNTHWAVRLNPTHSMFIAFLMSSFYATVPSSVGAALAEQLRRESPLVMSHGDICPKNIIVDKSQIIAIMGWDCAGWYPDWWEYVKFFEARTSDKNSDWYEYASEIFCEEFPAELAAYQGVVRCQLP